MNIDQLTPIEILQRRKAEIDRYIERMNRVKSSGSFYDFYVNKSKEFERAILKLRSKEQAPDSGPDNSSL
jgi:hypothetical protein